MDINKTYKRVRECINILKDVGVKPHLSQRKLRQKIRRGISKETVLTETLLAEYADVALYHVQTEEKLAKEKKKKKLAKEKKRKLASQTKIKEYLKIETREGGRYVIVITEGKYSNSLKYTPDLDRGKKYQKLQAICTLKAIFTEEIVSNCKSGKYIYLARLIKALDSPEEPLKDMHVHHLNGNSTDNRVENLISLLKTAHIKLHDAERKIRVLPCLVEPPLHLSKREAINGFELVYFVKGGKLLSCRRETTRRQKILIQQQKGKTTMRLNKENILSLLEESLLIQYALVADGRVAYLFPKGYDERLCLELGLTITQTVKGTIRKRVSDAMKERGYIKYNVGNWVPDNTSYLTTKPERVLTYEEVKNLNKEQAENEEKTTQKLLFNSRF